ncbi:ENTH domain-containing protein [Abeliophyllum distichum]|uniref:ENTH domain-containing protein n=1 Tax=Abeliophyllum distichum TaxID=126358 RepID=A0ABD1RFH2_9LAMI
MENTYLPSSYSSSYSSREGYGDIYDEDHYGSKDDDRNGYGREREWGQRDDDRYGRYGDSYGRDGTNTKSVLAGVAIGMMTTEEKVEALIIINMDQQVEVLIKIETVLMKTMTNILQGSPIFHILK